MSAQSTADAPAEWRLVHLREYPEPLDLLGKDLISRFRCSKEEVSSVVGKLASKSEMKTEELPGEYVTSLTGEIADEVHEWPNATLGPEFRHLILQFRDGQLTHLVWKCQTFASPQAKPWWKLW